jgi:hypothetical protein
VNLATAPVEWTTSDYALIVSLVSLCFAVASFCWNIWSKFIFPKPRIEVKIAFIYAVGGSADWPSAINLIAINHGPIEVTLNGTIGFVSPNFPFGKSKRAILRAYQNWPYNLVETAFGETPGLPTRLAVGEQFNAYYPEAVMKNKELTNLGYADGFGREHFANKKSRRAFKSAIRAQK